MTPCTVAVLGAAKGYIDSCGPDIKKQFRIAISRLAQGKDGDTHAFTGELDGFYRLRVGSHRIIYRYCSGRVIECVYAGPRATVYDAFIPPG
ncbi:cytotoxic translational repressor of toxin-antitoxin stability system [Opitutaceae bacterium TAV5]|nr:cytotoxic translational repressor of toxin-antitoxin stability system [Opitutaceae bacterium TAV5]